MRISIWQQFSSNHSASFLIVGTFESETTATQAANKVRDILRRIARYWQQLPQEEADSLWKRILYHGEITPIEQEISQELGVEWSKDIRGDRRPHGIDWLPWNPDKAMQAVTLIDQHVFITNIGNTDVGSEPFETLLRQFGATVIGNYEESAKPSTVEGLLRVHFHCRVPDESALQKVLANLTIRARPLGATWREEHYRQWEEYAKGEFEPDIAIHVGEPPLFLDEAQIEIHGLELALNGLTYWHPKEIVEGLLSYLKSYGCQDIEYKFTQD